MKTNKNQPHLNSIDNRLKDYAKQSKAFSLKPFDNSKTALKLGAAFIGGMSAAEASIVYSGLQNVAVSIPVNFNQVQINLNGAGGNDFEIQNNVVGGVAFIQANEVGGGDFALTGFVGDAVGAYAYPFANNAGFVIGAAGPWVNGVGDANTLADNGAYPNPHWETNGMTRFIGFRGTLGGGLKYGWIRLTRNNHLSWTIVDWAYESSNNVNIIAGDTFTPLAVDLVSFKAIFNKQTSFLKWITSSEKNNAGFEIERSEDASNFKSIAWVEGKGTTTEKQEYLYDDKNLRFGKTYYYRLKQVDFDGSINLSNIVSVKSESKDSFVGEFYPNPAIEGKVSLDFEAKENGKWDLNVFDGAGNKFQQSQITVGKGSNTVPFNFDALPKGMYFVKIENKSDQIYRKFIKN